MTINNSELLIGSWITKNGRLEKDDICLKIEQLIQQDMQLINEGNGWTRLYIDNNNQYWELSYPQGHLHGGGPPQLKKILITDVSQWTP